MATLKEILLKQHDGMFVMLKQGLASIPDQPVDAYQTEELTALRLVLHALEAIDNYFSLKTPPNFGAFLPHGRRSSNMVTDFPSHADITAYLTEVQDRTRAYLTTLSDAEFLSTGNNWNWELLNLFFYVSNHTYSHLGHLDQLLYDAGDPRGWQCWSYNFEGR